MRTTFPLTVLASLAWCLLCNPTVHAAKPSVAAALDKRISVEFAETPLAEALQQLAEKADIEITFDEKYLPNRSKRDEASTDGPGGPNPFAGDESQDPLDPFGGVPAEAQTWEVDPLGVWLTAQDISLRSALTLIVEQHGFVYQLQADKIAILPEHDVEPIMTTKVYQAEDLSLPYDNGGRDFERELLYLISTSIALPTWEEVGRDALVRGTRSVGGTPRRSPVSRSRFARTPAIPSRGTGLALDDRKHSGGSVGGVAEFPRQVVSLSQRMFFHNHAWAVLVAALRSGHGIDTATEEEKNLCSASRKHSFCDSNQRWCSWGPTWT